MGRNQPKHARANQPRPDFTARDALAGVAAEGAGAFRMRPNRALLRPCILDLIHLLARVACGPAGAWSVIGPPNARRGG